MASSSKNTSHVYPRSLPMPPDVVLIPLTSPITQTTPLQRCLQKIRCSREPAHAEEADALPVQRDYFVDETRQALVPLRFGNVALLVAEISLHDDLVDQPAHRAALLAHPHPAAAIA